VPPADIAVDELSASLLDLTVAVPSVVGTRFDSPLTVGIREARLLNDSPWARTLGSLNPTVRVEGWKFPTPVGDAPPPVAAPPGGTQLPDVPTTLLQKLAARKLRPMPPPDNVVFKDRLLYLLQPPLENLFVGKQVNVPFPPYPYQLEGMAFLMPRRSALLADEMGLGKTMQAILSIRLLMQSGMIRRVLLVCPKPLVFNWGRELKCWAPDLPFEVIAGNTAARRAAWAVSNAPLKIVNYEVLTRDMAIIEDDTIRFDLVILDEAQRIKNRESKTAQAARALRRDRSWALTGTPIENKPEDLINLFAFVDDGRVPDETPTKQLPALTADCILRRTKDDVLSDLPGKTVTDAHLELTAAQREAYDMAEQDGVVHLTELGDTVSVQHVFELVMRLKQICNFDPKTGDSCKLERLMIDVAEAAESGRKALIFSQWVEPLERLAEELAEYGPMQYHGRIPQRERTSILDRFRDDKSKHVLLMSYGTGSVGLNLQFANYVFLFDRWWNPAIEDQAINRAHRIGQKEPVFVTRFITQDTIENRIAEILDRKRQLFDELISQNGPPPRLGLSEEEIFGLFSIPHRHRKAVAA
jgi:SNF2 family DNA or RNA helicase